MLQDLRQAIRQLLRQALGATRGNVSRLVVVQGMRLALTGLIVGLLIALATTGVLRRLLFGVTRTDPVTLAAVALLVLGVAGGCQLAPGPSGNPGRPHGDSAP